MTLPRESSPDITIPNIFVITSYEGVALSDIETLITLPIERKLKGLKDVEEIRSVSAEGSLMITIEFTPKVDIDNALQLVRAKVDHPVCFWAHDVLARPDGRVHEIPAPYLDHRAQFFAAGGPGHQPGALRLIYAHQSQFHDIKGSIFKEPACGLVP